MREPSTITYRAANGFAEATNESVIAALGDFRKFCTNEDFYINRILAPAYLNRSAAFLQLPDELLLNIASHLTHPDRNQDFRHLAPTCRRFHGVVHGSLTRKATITPSGTRAYLEALLQHPDIASKLSMLDLHHQRRLRWPIGPPAHPDVWALMGSTFFRSCSDIMRLVCSSHSAMLEWSNNMCGSEGSLRPACLAVVLLLAAPLDELKISNDLIRGSRFLEGIMKRQTSVLISYVFVSHQPFFSEHVGISQWPVDVIENISHKIKALEVTETQNYYSVMHLGLVHFQHLNELSVPARHIIYASRRTTQSSTCYTTSPTHTLPRSLVSLKTQVGGNRKDQAALLLWIEHLIQQRGHFSNLRHVLVQCWAQPEGTMEVITRELLFWAAFSNLLSMEIFAAKTASITGIADVGIVFEVRPRFHDIFRDLTSIVAGV